MSSIHEDLNKKWRLTCNFNTDGMVYKDYVIATHANIPLLPPNSVHNRCKKVESIDIRGKDSCVNCNVVVRHKNGLGLPLIHIIQATIVLLTFLVVQYARGTRRRQLWILRMCQ